MQQKSAAWWAALTAPSADWRYGVDILASDEQTPLEDPTVVGMNATDRLVPGSTQISLDVTQVVHRSLSLTLRNDDGRYLPGPAGIPSGGPLSQAATGLVWYNVRYRPWVDLRTGFDATGAKIYDRTYLGVYVLSQPDQQVKVVGSQMVLTLLDKVALLSKPYLISNTTLPTFSKGGHTVGGYASGSTFDAVMKDLATRGGIPANKQLFEPSSLTLPADYSISEGTEFWTHLSRLAGSMAHVIYFDSYGNLVRRSDPLLGNNPSVYTFAPGAYSIISEVDRKTDLQSTYNHVVVVGGSSKTGTVRGEAQVTDPSSPYHKSQIGDRVVFVGKGGKLNDMTPDPGIGTTAQATTRAQQLLAQHIGLQEIVELKARNVAALEDYDRITIAVPNAGLALDFVVQQLTWNLHHDGMTIDATRWFAIGS